MNVKIIDSTAKNKRLTAIFTDDKGKKVKTTNFGFKGGSTFIDHKDETKKKNYLARHKVRENWNDYMSAGSLARFILWNKPTLTESIKDYKKRFNLN
tara:strand:+ start:2169 stop:2459 length:291 start_codon:yes stop_codon:yes gene_type:complete